jgi:hypothetical protein
VRTLDAETCRAAVSSGKPDQPLISCPVYCNVFHADADVDAHEAVVLTSLHSKDVLMRMWFARDGRKMDAIALRAACWVDVR